jgi:hypothetical protein
MVGAPIQESHSLNLNNLLFIHFYFYSLGGNPVISGFASPDAKTRKMASKTAVEGAIFESNQTITNKMNSVMQQICEISVERNLFVRFPHCCFVTIV